MARITTSFTIEEELLAQVEELAAELDRDRSSTLRQLITVGIPVLREHQARVARPSLSELIVGPIKLQRPAPSDDGGKR